MKNQSVNSAEDWTSQIPVGWNIAKLKSLFDYSKGLSITKENLLASGVPVISYGQIHAKDNTGVCVLSELYQYVSPDYLESSPESLVKRGDFIVADTSEDLAGCGNYVYIDISKQLFAGYHTIILRRKDETDNKYFAYLFLTDPWRDQIRSRVSGIKVFSITKDILMNTSVIVPPKAEQKRIAQFLDKKYLDINDIIKNTRLTIEEYKHLKQSIITDAVTNGIQKNRLTRESGIDWIGKVPADWNIQKIKTIFTIRDERNYMPLEKVNLISLYTDKGVVQHSDLQHTTGNKATNAYGYKKVYVGDIVVNIILCWMGAIGRSKYEGVTSPAYDIYIPASNIDSRFYHYYFRTSGFSGDCYKYGRGIMAMRWRTYSNEFRSIKVVVPPLIEQREISDYLDKKCSEIDALISDKEQLLLELEKYKKSLIYEYVTGKKKVV